MQAPLSSLALVVGLLGAAPQPTGPASAPAGVPRPAAALPAVPPEVLDANACDTHFAKIDAPAVRLHDLSFVGRDVFVTMDVDRFEGRLPAAPDARYGFVYVQLDAGPGVYTTADFGLHRRVIAFHDLSRGRHRVAVALLSGASYVPYFAQCFDAR
jgi:hypothetical protein